MLPTAGSLYREYIIKIISGGIFLGNSRGILVVISEGISADIVCEIPGLRLFSKDTVNYILKTVANLAFVR